MTPEKMLISHQGSFEYETINHLLIEASSHMDNIGVERKIKKRTFCVMAEFLENIQKHTDYLKSQNMEGKNLTKSRFTFQQQNGDLVLTTGNLIYNKNIKRFKNRLERLNKLDINGLKRLYRYSISNTNISEKGGAGLGFIDIALKARNKIQYSFKPLNAKVSYCVLQVKISNKENIG